MLILELLQTAKPNTQIGARPKTFRARRKAYFRAVKSNTRQAIRRQYFIWDGLRDWRMAIGRNEDIFVASMIASAGIIISAAVLTSEVVFWFYHTAYEVSELSGASMLLLSLIATGVLATLVTWVGTFLLNAITLSGLDGAMHRKIRSVRSTFRQALARTSKVAGIWALIVVAILGPIILGVLLFGIFLLFNPLPFEATLRALPYGLIAALTWSLTVLSRTSLAPIVALYEPDMALSDTFDRSQQLTARRGRLFITCSYLAAAGLAVGVFALLKLVGSVLGVDLIIVFIVFCLILTVVLQGLMLSLYRKRRLARTR